MFRWATTSLSFIPMNDTVSDVPTGTLIEKRPSMSVTAFSLEPLAVMVAPTSGSPLASFTVPVTVALLLCKLVSGLPLLCGKRLFSAIAPAGLSKQRQPKLHIRVRREAFRQQASSFVRSFCSKQFILGFFVFSYNILVGEVLSFLVYKLVRW